MAKQNHFNDMPFTGTNYKLLLIGLGVVVLGFLLMAGGVWIVWMERRKPQN